MNLTDIVLLIAYCLATALIFTALAAVPVAPPVRLRESSEKQKGRRK